MMWCPEGYITMDEILSQISWDSDLIESAVDKPVDPKKDKYEQTFKDNIEYAAYINWMVAALFYVSGKDFRLCLASGAIVRFRPYILAWMASDTKLASGISGGFPEKYEDRKLWSQIEFEALHSEKCTIRRDLPSDFDSSVPIGGSSLCIREVDLPVSLEELAAWLLHEAPRLAKGTSTTKENEGRKELAQRIVDAFHSGKVRTKPEAKRVFGQGMKHEEWNAYWSEATNIMPSLSRPGPRRI